MERLLKDLEQARSADVLVCMLDRGVDFRASSAVYSAAVRAVTGFLRLIPDPFEIFYTLPVLPALEPTLGTCSTGGDGSGGAHFTPQLLDELALLSETIIAAGLPDSALPPPAASAVLSFWSVEGVLQRVSTHSICAALSYSLSDARLDGLQMPDHLAAEIDERLEGGVLYSKSFPAYAYGLHAAGAHVAYVRKALQQHVRHEDIIALSSSDVTHFLDMLHDYFCLPWYPATQPRPARPPIAQRGKAGVAGAAVLTSPEQWPVGLGQWPGMAAGSASAAAAEATALVTKEQWAAEDVSLGKLLVRLVEQLADLADVGRVKLRSASHGMLLARGLMSTLGDAVNAQDLHRELWQLAASTMKSCSVAEDPVGLQELIGAMEYLGEGDDEEWR